MVCEFASPDVKRSKAGVTKPSGSWVTALDASENPSSAAQIDYGEVVVYEPCRCAGARGATKNLWADIATRQKEK
jgi:hypothetical protein